MTNEIVVGAFVEAGGVRRTPVKPASPRSLFVQGLRDDEIKPKDKAAKRRYAMSAKGVTTAASRGIVTVIRDDILAIRFKSDRRGKYKVEHAMVEDCRLVPFDEIDDWAAAACLDTYTEHYGLGATS